MKEKGKKKKLKKENKPHAHAVCLGVWAVYAHVVALASCQQDLWIVLPVCMCARMSKTNRHVIIIVNSKEHTHKHKALKHTHLLINLRKQQRKQYIQKNRTKRKQTKRRRINGRDKEARKTANKERQKRKIENRKK